LAPCSTGAATATTTNNHHHARTTSYFTIELARACSVHFGGPAGLCWLYWGDVYFELIGNDTTHPGCNSNPSRQPLRPPRQPLRPLSQQQPPPPQQQQPTVQSNRQECVQSTSGDRLDCWHDSTGQVDFCCDSAGAAATATSTTTTSTTYFTIEPTRACTVHFGGPARLCLFDLEDGYLKLVSGIIRQWQWQSQQQQPPPRPPPPPAQPTPQSNQQEHVQSTSGDLLDSVSLIWKTVINSIQVDEFCLLPPCSAAATATTTTTRTTDFAVNRQERIQSTLGDLLDSVGFIHKKYASKSSIHYKEQRHKPFMDAQLDKADSFLGIPASLTRGDWKYFGVFIEEAWIGFGSVGPFVWASV
jgi:hypothetical protein